MVADPTSLPRRWPGALLFLVCALLSHAQRYSFKHYSQENGLSNLSINTINQDQDGFLWVATDNGLFRYNGRRFQHFGSEDGLVQDDVTALAVSPGGAVWAGTPVGIAYLTAGLFNSAPSGPGLGERSPGRLSPAATGNAAYASTGHGIVQLVLASEHVSVTQLYVGETFGVAVAAEGTVWFGCGSDLCRLQGRKSLTSVRNWGFLLSIGRAF